MSNLLKYYHPYCPLIGAYEEAVGLDCVPVAITVEFYSGRKITIDNLPLSSFDIRDRLNKIILKDKLLSLLSTVRGIRWVKCDSGIVQQPSNNFWILACANSRLTKCDLVLQNGLGIIDPDYRGTIRFIYHTTHPSYSTNWIELLTKSCGQLVAIPRVTNLQLDMQDNPNNLTNTTRGTSGFGSTNK